MTAEQLNESGTAQEPEAIEQNSDPFIKLGGSPTTPLAVGGFGSNHGTVLFAFCDGSVRAEAGGSPATFAQLANRKDRTIIQEDR
jgi:hypothetical protein